jgi:hypothetical protein
VLVYRDELMGLLASWESDGREGDRAFYLECHNGKSKHRVERIGRGHIHIPNMCAALFGCITPDKLATYFTPDNLGARKRRAVSAFSADSLP